MLTEGQIFPISFKNEFTHQPGVTVSAGFSYIFGKRFEPGLEFNYTTLRGYNNTPDFSANGFHYRFLNPVTEPVFYNSELLGKYLFFRYYFRDVTEPRRKQKLNQFVGVKLGSLLFATKLEYKDKEGEAPIFVKGNGTQPNPGFNFIWSAGYGLRYEVSDHLGIRASANLNIADYDCLDAVHNYSETGERQRYSGIFGQLLFELTYSFDTRKKIVRQYIPWRRR